MHQHPKVHRNRRKENHRHNPVHLAFPSKSILLEGFRPILKWTAKVCFGDSTSRNQYSLTRISDQNSHSSRSAIDAGSYAPLPLSSKPPTESKSLLNAFDVGNSKSEFPQATAPLELMAPKQNPYYSHVSARQAVMSDLIVSYSMDIPYRRCQRQ